MSDKQLVDGFVSAGLQVVAITDHHVIDIARIRRMQELAAQKLTILPGIELRSELGGSEHVHYVAIFPEDCDLDDVWIKLQSLGISAADVKSKGDENVYVGFADGCKRIHDLGGVVTVHAGKKSNSIEQLANADAIKRTIKQDLAKKYLNALEVGRLSDCADYRKIVFPHFEKELPLLICSDNHSIADYSTKCPMWIKADQGFLGLLQLLNEPSSRVYLGDTPPCVSRSKRNPTKYMDAISFEKTDQANTEDEWFSGSIPLNHGLVAIIGNKGNGKSALADVMALLGDTRMSQHFSFLTRTRFLAPKTKFGDMFHAKVTWHSGREIQRELSATVDPAAPELVKYIPQNYLESICSEIKESRETGFDRELMEVIFSHVPDAEQIGNETLSELINYLTNEKEERIGQVLVRLANANDDIVALEDQSTDDHRRSLESQLEQLRKELEAHDRTKPAEVREPAQDPQARKAMEAITAAIAEMQRRADELQKGISTQQEELRQAARQLAAAGKLSTRIENLEGQVSAFHVDGDEEGKILGLDITELVSLTVNRQPIVDAKNSAELRRQHAEKALDAETEGSLAAQQQMNAAEVTEKRLQLDEPNRRYQTYLQQLNDWQKKRDEIVGSPGNSKSVKGLESKIIALSNLPTVIANQKRLRDELVQEILRTKESLLAEYRKLYSPVQRFIDENPISQNGTLQFCASIAVDSLVEGLLSMIHQGRKGSFQGELEGRARLRELVSSADFSTHSGVLDFLSTIQHHLDFDKQDGDEKLVRLRDQLRQHVSPQDVYNYLYGLSYLRPRFELRWQGKSLDQLSQGERGSLLLVFYLLIDKRDIPLIIDQPEENLDNETIATLLVPAIKDAKSRRQVILVTHNPNIAVVCDADQIIHASIDKTAGNRVTYTSGAIENPVMTKLVIDVLEGTKPAFDLRDAKYEILERPT